MARFKILPTSDVSGYFTAKVKGAITDKDLGKAVKLSVDATDTYELCATGNGIDAFIVGIEAATADGLKLCTLNNKGYKRVEMVGASTVGAFVHSGVVAAAGTAEANKLPLVVPHTAVAADVIRWRIVSANTANGVVATGDQTVVVERV